MSNGADQANHEINCNMAKKKKGRVRGEGFHSMDLGETPELTPQQRNEREITQWGRVLPNRRQTMRKQMQKQCRKRNCHQTDAPAEGLPPLMPALIFYHVELSMTWALRLKCESGIGTV